LIITALLVTERPGVCRYLNPTAMFMRETTGPHPEPNNSAKIQAVRDNS